MQHSYVVLEVCGSNKKNSVWFRTHTSECGETFYLPQSEINFLSAEEATLVGNGTIWI